MSQQKITFSEISSNAAIVTSQLDSASANGTGAILVPSGTTSQRPSSTTQGYIRYNTTLNTLESANGTAWSNVGSGSTSSGGVSWQAVQNTSFIAIAGNGYAVNTATGNVVVTLPASPTPGQIIQITDYAQTFSSNSCILYPNGNKINANTSNVSLASVSGSVGLVYIDSIRGWIAYSGFTITPLSTTYSINYLVVAGGGGGGGDRGGGGGAGGLIYTTTVVNSGLSYAVSVGAGGSGGSGSGITGSGGTGSSFGTITSSIGGGGGGSVNAPSNGYGTTGGSGGGGAGLIGPNTSGGAASGTAGQGNPGGNGLAGGNGTGGGGGASTSGTSASSGGAPGGNGSTYSISGSSVTYAGGGGGSSDNRSFLGYGTGGTGGGGAGGATNSNGSNGSGNTGGGGGGGSGGVPVYAGGAGGSGIVIISYPSPQRGTGGTVTSSGGQTIHTFTSSSTFTA